MLVSNDGSVNKTMPTIITDMSLLFSTFKVEPPVRSGDWGFAGRAALNTRIVREIGAVRQEWSQPHIDLIEEINISDVVTLEPIESLNIPLDTASVHLPPSRDLFPSKAQVCAQVIKAIGGKLKVFLGRLVGVYATLRLNRVHSVEDEPGVKLR